MVCCMYLQSHHGYSDTQCPSWMVTLHPECNYYRIVPVAGRYATCHMLIRLLMFADDCMIADPYRFNKNGFSITSLNENEMLSLS